MVILMKILRIVEKTSKYKYFKKIHTDFYLQVNVLKSKYE